MTMSNTSRRNLRKAFTIAATACATVGIPAAALVYLSGAMTPIPRFSASQLALALPLPTLAFALAASALFLRRRDPSGGSRAWPITVLLASLLTMLMLAATFSDMSHPRFLPPQPQFPKVNISMENNSPESLADISFQGGGVEWGFDSLPPGSTNEFDHDFPIEWKDRASARITFVDAKTRTTNRIDLPLSPANDQIRSGRVRNVKFRILAHDKAVVICE
jgi:hypothetical protein